MSDIYKPRSTEERVDFYLGQKLINSNGVDVTKFDGIKTIRNLVYADIFYDMKLRDLLISTHNNNKKFFYHRGDISDNLHELTLCKNRCAGNKSSVILRTLNFNRHWQYYYQRTPDILYEDKLPIIFWRGSTTGKTDRFTLTSKWCDVDSDIDVGFSILRQNADVKYAKYVKGGCKIVKFLEHKYILSVEGNDKDSGLNWKLNSNSLVLMPEPKICSWLMEDMLIPNYHYVLIKSDFSDLKEKLIWCNDNPELCKQIVKNANVFMQQFSDETNECEIEKLVINKYFKLINNQ